MKIITVSKLLGIASILFCFQVYATADTTSISKLSTSMKGHFENTGNTQITYQCLEYYNVNMPGYDKEKLQAEIQKYQKLKEDRNNGKLTEDQEQFWLKVSDSDIDKIIDERTEVLKGRPTDAIYVFSTDGTKIRQDVYRPDAPNVQEFFYLYDGINGTMTTHNDNTVRTGDFLGQRWNNFSCFARFGSGIEKIFEQPENYQTRLVSEDGKQKLIVENASLQNRGRQVKFTLLDSNLNYWTQCDHIQNGKVIIRFTCEDFEDNEGLLVPKIVHRQKPHFGTFRDEYVLTLIDVKNGNVDFDSNFFTTSTSESPIVRRMERR